MRYRVTRKTPNINLLKPQFREGLAGRWSWGGFGSTTLYDDTNFGNNGTLVSTTSWGPGRFAGERSIQYDGSVNSRINLGTDNVVFNHNGNFAAMAWVWVESFAATRTIMAEDDSNVSKKWSFKITTSGFLQYGQYSGTTGAAVTTTSHPIKVGEWAHVAISKSGSVLSGWVNGNKVSWTSTVAHSNSGQSSPALRFGAYRVTADRMQGNMTDVRIYNRSITDSEALAIAKGYDTVVTRNGFDSYSQPPSFVERCFGVIF